MDAAAPDAVVLRDVAVRRGDRDVLTGISATVPVGQVVGLLGPSGCGKTTLMRCVVGVQAHVRGDVTVLGLPAGSREVRRDVGYVTQAPAVYGDLSVEENLTYFARVVRADRGTVDGTVRTIGLDAYRRSRVDRLSGGQRARVSLATALLGRPRLLVLDEPTVGLDPVLREDLWSLFRRLAGEGTTLLVSSHVMDEAARCDRLLLLREGGLLADATPRELLDRTGAADLEQAFLRLVLGDRPGAAL